MSLAGTRASPQCFCRCSPTEVGTITRIIAPNAVAAVLIAAGFPASAMSQTHVAASITYEETPRPAGLPYDLQPLPDVRLRFLSISAIDGFKIAAALWQPLAKPAASTTLLVQVHGSDLAM